MRIGPRKLVAVLLAGTTLGALIFAVATWGTAAGVVMVGALQLVLLLGMGAGFVELDRRRRRGTRRVELRLERVLRELRTAARDQHRHTDRKLSDLDTSLQALNAGHADLAAALERLDTTLPERLTKQSRNVARSLSASERRLRRHVDASVQQVDALIGLYVDLQPNRALPITDGWAASADLLRACLDAVDRQRPQLILECGSGASTLVLAYACRRANEGRVIALDHDATFAESTRQLLRDHDLESWAEVRTAPLEPLEGDLGMWYRRSEVPDGTIDLVLVDGPPAGKNPQARVPALDVVYGQLSPSATVLVDDYQRAGEQAMVAGWLERFPDFDLEERQAKKGLAVLRRRSPAVNGQQGDTGEVTDPAAIPQ